jgi:hypothetical protein
MAYLLSISNIYMHEFELANALKSSFVQLKKK